MEENNINKSNKIKMFILTMLILLVSVAGISYAYFTIQITGNDTASSMRLRTANMQLVYNDVQIISGEYVTPGWSDTKTLTITNNGNVTANYSIVWRDLINEITNNELVIYATCSSSTGTCDNITETAVPTYIAEAHNISVKRNISIPVGVTHTYTLTVEFKETGSNQNYNQNKYFNGTLNIAEGTEPATLSLLTDNGTSGLSIGDVVRATKSGIDNQDFYVVSTNASETVLLAKYNLMVGNSVVAITRYDDYYIDSWSEYQITSLSSNSSYGLQSADALGYTSFGTAAVGVVPFSGTNYWDDGNGNLISPYTANGASYSGNPYPNVYDSSMANVDFVLNENNDNDINFYTPVDDGYHRYNLADNGYTIAYYVEGYVNRLGISGIGRLLTYEEAQSLASTNSSIVYNGTDYWLGSAKTKYDVHFVKNNNTIASNSRTNFSVLCVRPVIVVNTSDIQS